MPATRLALVAAAIAGLATAASAQDLFDELAPQAAVEAVPAPKATPKRFDEGLRRPIGELTLTAPVDSDLAESLDRLPEGFAIADPAQRRFESAGVRYVDAGLGPSRFAAAPVHWAAPATCSNPLWFEQANLERYGHHRRLCEADVLTPSAISAAHFFADAAVLPWRAFASPACDCDYTLGAYRPGSCNPHQWVRCERPVLGASGEALAVAGLILLIP